MIGTEREFDASHLYLGRVRPGIANITDSSKWQWFAGSETGGQATWSTKLAAAQPVLTWSSHTPTPSGPRTPAQRTENSSASG